jgi:hypothetical protein
MFCPDTNSTCASAIPALDVPAATNPFKKFGVTIFPDMKLLDVGNPSG